MGMMYPGMMDGNWQYGGMGVFGGVLATVTWIVFLAFLIAATRYLWKKGGK